MQSGISFYSTSLAPCVAELDSCHPSSYLQQNVVNRCVCTMANVAADANGTASAGGADNGVQRRASTAPAYPGMLRLLHRNSS
jgi:hypothetical protein